MINFTARLKELLNEKEFISVATADLKGSPNAAPKLLLKMEDNFVYLIDYTIGRTWENLKVNPRASLSLMDFDTLNGYQLNGSVEIIDSGPEYEAVLKELLERKINLSAKRIVEGLYRGRKHHAFEVALPEKFVVFKVRLNELVQIGPGGDLQREALTN